MLIPHAKKPILSLYDLLKSLYYRCMILKKNFREFVTFILKIIALNFQNLTRYNTRRSNLNDISFSSLSEKLTENKGVENIAQNFIF